MRQTAFTVAARVDAAIREIPRKAAKAVAGFVAPRKVSIEG